MTVELLVYVAAGVVLVIYVYQVVYPKLLEISGGRPDPDERAAELLEEHRRSNAEDRAKDAAEGGK